MLAPRMAHMRIWSIALAALQIACGDASVASPPPEPRGTFHSKHFRFDYPMADSVHIGATGARLEQEYDRILADLGVAAHAMSSSRI